jgi:hypothetical protein
VIPQTHAHSTAGTVEVQTTDPHRFRKLSVELKRSTAFSYATRLGMSAFPVIDKQPPAGVEWSRWTGAAGVYDKDDAHWRLATGYALAVTTDSLVAVVDLDDPTFLPELLAAEPHLKDTFQVRRGDHVHFYIKLARPLGKSFLSLKVGGREVASLRSQGAYVVGPRSDHMSGQSYTPNNARLQGLSGYEQEQLVLLLTPKTAPALPDLKQPPLPTLRTVRPGITAIPQWTINKNQDAAAKIAETLRARGYKTHKDWLNGPCLHPENHVNGDKNPSFGVNVHTGVGHCFSCGSFSPRHVAQALGIEQRNSFSARAVAFSGVQPTSKTTPNTIQIELNIAVEFNRRRRAAAGRLWAVLFDYARVADGQHTYRLAEILHIGDVWHLSRNQVLSALGLLVELGIMDRREAGVYVRAGLERTQQLLGIGADYALVHLPVEAVKGRIGSYSSAITVIAEQQLDGTPSVGLIAGATGVSKSTIYRHENDRNVIRKTSVKRIGLATATDKAFAKVFDYAGRPVVTISIKRNGDGAYGAMRLADQVQGSVWAWEQSPSHRDFNKIIFGRGVYMRGAALETPTQKNQKEVIPNNGNGNLGGRKFPPQREG